MSLSAAEYARLAKASAPHSKTAVNCAKAFVTGGGICTLGQAILLWGEAQGLSESDASLLCTVALIFLSAALTGLGLYDKLARHAGAGTLVPITGFANSITAPAIEFKTEGFVTGLGAKMFVIAGPVIVYGTVASVIYGIIYWITTLF